MKIVIWRNASDSDTDLNNSDVFYDFFKPLQILSGDGWSPEINCIENDEQYILTNNQNWPFAVPSGLDSKKKPKAPYPSKVSD